MCRQNSFRRLAVKAQALEVDWQPREGALLDEVYTCQFPSFDNEF
jgi:hypothetical protein